MCHKLFKIRFFSVCLVGHLAWTSIAFSQIPDTINRDEEIENSDELFQRDFGLEKNYSENNLKKLQEILANRKTLHKEGDKELEFIRYADERIQLALSPAASENSKKQTYGIGKRILYSLLVTGKKETPPLAESTARHALVKKVHWEKVTKNAKIIERLLFQDVNHSIAIPHHVNEPMGPDKAAKEASFLSEGVSFANLSPLQVGKIDIGNSHPAWRSLQNSQGLDAWREIEGWLEKSIQKVKKLNHPYSIDEARRILFFDGIKKSNTAPKLDAKDIYGVEWKIKWGEEVQTEPVAARLYLKLGAKFADLVYANGRGAKEMALILADPTQLRDPEDPCAHPINVSELSHCFKISRYGFNLDPYVETSGEITQSNVDQILSLLPAASSDLKISKLSLQGRHFVTFRETLVEISPPKKILVRGGSTPFSSLGALEDRVARSLMVFNFWIGNVDAKDDNNKAYLIKDYPLGNSDFTSGNFTYAEVQHDLGASLGGFITQGQISQLSTGEDFISRKTVLAVGGGFLPAPDLLLNLPRIGSERLFFKDPVLYYPQAWHSTTFSDAFWMAEKIVNLFNYGDLEEIISHTQWPDFMQLALLYKLVDRRNQIAKEFGFETISNPVRDVRVALAAPQDRLAAALRYRVNPEMLETYYQKALSVKKAQLAGTTLDEDILLKNGILSSCETTVLMSLIEQENHPSGLEKRIGRLFDGKDRNWQECTYGAEGRSSEYVELLKLFGDGIFKK